MTDYAEKLWKLEQLKHMRDELHEVETELVSKGKNLSSTVEGLGYVSAALSKINTQITTLLEDGEAASQVPFKIGELVGIGPAHYGKITSFENYNGDDCVMVDVLERTIELRMAIKDLMKIKEDGL